MAELVRVYHNLSTAEAQRLVDSLVERRIPLVWEGGDIRRVLNPSMTLRDQILVLLSTSRDSTANSSDLFDWTGYGNRSYFLRLLREMHKKRLLELSRDEKQMQILPPGGVEAAEIIRRASR